jgi:beta-xylosidase
MKYLLILAVSIGILSCETSEKRETLHNQFYPGEIWKDNKGEHINAHGGGILFDKDTYYWYGEHKIEGVAGNVAHVGVHCYSSNDLYNWKDEGVALEVVKDDATHEITKECVLERPKVVYNKKTKRYVMFFHLEYKGRSYETSRTGVAVSKSPTGPFTFVKSYRPNAGIWPQNVLEEHKELAKRAEKSYYGGGPGSLPVHADSVNLLGSHYDVGQMARDQTVFVDDDGKAYHVYSSESNSTLHISLLTDDYMSESGIYYRFFSNSYHEAPAMFKHNGTYYLLSSGCTGWAPNEARISSAPNIFGPWTEIGNPCIGYNTKRKFGPEKTFGGQSTFVLPIEGKKDAFIALFDIWNPTNAIDGRYAWLPITFNDGKLQIVWKDAWSY